MRRLLRKSNFKKLLTKENQNLLTCRKKSKENARVQAMNLAVQQKVCLIFCVVYLALESLHFFTLDSYNRIIEAINTHDFTDQINTVLFVLVIVYPITFLLKLVLIITGLYHLQVIRFLPALFMVCSTIEMTLRSIDSTDVNTITAINYNLMIVPLIISIDFHMDTVVNVICFALFSFYIQPACSPEPFTLATSVVLGI